MHTIPVCNWGTPFPIKCSGLLCIGNPITLHFWVFWNNHCILLRVCSVVPASTQHCSVVPACAHCVRCPASPVLCLLHPHPLWTALIQRCLFSGTSPPLVHPCPCTPASVCACILVHHPLLCCRCTLHVCESVYHSENR